MVKVQKEATSDLCNLMNQYPDLPVVPIIGPEVYADYDCSDGFVVGSWGKCFVDEYLFMSERNIFFLKSEKDIQNVLEGYFFWEDYHKLLEEKADCEQIYNALPWKKAIMVYVDSPEDLVVSSDQIM